MPCAPHCACLAIPRRCNSLPRPSTPHRMKWDPCWGWSDFLILYVPINTTRPTRYKHQPSSASQSSLTASLMQKNVSRSVARQYRNNHLTAASYSLKASGEPIKAASSASWWRKNLSTNEFASKQIAKLTTRASHVLTLTGLEDLHLWNGHDLSVLLNCKIGVTFEYTVDSSWLDWDMQCARPQQQSHFVCRQSSQGFERRAHIECVDDLLD